MSANQPLGPYRIGERVGAQVWIAEDTRNGKTVAIKLLSKQLPKDAARRESLIRDVRVTAALYHTFLVPILEITPVGDNLLMVMERLEAKPLYKHVGGKPLEREELCRIAWQLVDVLKYVHIKTIIHGNVNGDSVMVLPNGQVKLGGLNLLNLLRRDGSSTAYQQKGTDARCVSYMAPEQITGQTTDEKTDVFSTGVVLYEMATGRLPFPGNTAADIARAIVEGQPASPKAVNPALDNGVMGILGNCLFRDPFKRYKDAKSLLEAVGKLDPNAVAFAQQLEKKITAPAAAGATETRRTILFIADVATHYDATEAEARATGRMQQILGESIYLFDGKVIDPFAPKLVAEMPSVEAALEAGRKSEFDFSPDQQTGEPIDVRMLLHAGELELHDGMPAGPAVEKAYQTLKQLPPNTLFISEEFAKEGRGNARLRDAGARGGMKLYTIVAPEPKQEEPPEPSTAEIEAEVIAEAEALAALQRARHRKRMRALAIASVGFLIFALVLGMMWMRRRDRAAAIATPVATAQSSAPQPATAATPRKVLIADFTVEGADPALAERANAIRLGTIEVLRAYPELRVAETSAADVTPFSARIRAGAAGPEIAPTSGASAGPAAPVPDVATGITALVQWVSSQVQMQPRAIVAADAMNAFADAVVARSMNDVARADASLRTALAADPNFLSAQLLAMRFYETNGKPAESLAAAKQVVALDPANLEAARKVARASLAAGDLQQAFAAYGAVLRREPRDAEALNLVARYALGAGDTARFTATLAKLKGVPAATVASHEPDQLLAAGRLDAAAQRYYDVEAKAPNNPALALKIGRLAVLRHSLEIADIELKKLGQTDPLYGGHILQAYIAAEKRDRATAESELKTGLAASSPGDDAWTSAAEVYAILADTDGVISALERAAQRKEPTAAYVLANPLFRYLANDPKFEGLKATLTAQQGEIRQALAQIP